MKMIFVVTFFGILTFAFADYSKIEKCQEHEPMSHFNNKKFLQGTWHVTNAKQGSNSTVCRRYKTSLKGSTVKLNGDGYYTFHKKSIFFRVRCSGQSGHKCGKFSLKCKQTAKETGIPAIEFDLEVTVLETDYNEFAVMYICVTLPPTLGSQIEDNFLVLHRDSSNTNDPDPRISTTLTQHNLSLEKLISRKGVNCPKPPKRNKKGKN
uniref:Putative tm816 triabin-like lipocalin n=1 Tax=Panstrongylus lignarius TaxID=156445 RepID=A0A224XXY6_9HEMI